MLSLNFRKEVTPEFRQYTYTLISIVSIVFLCLIGRLAYLQLFQGERFTYLSENNRIRLKKIPGTRGMIFDRRGQLLADSRPSFDLLFVPEDTTEPETTLRVLARLLGRDEKKLLSFFNKKKRRPPFGEIVLERDINWESVVAVETHQLDLPGITIHTHPRRSYLNGKSAAHLLGYLGEIGSKKLKNWQKRGYRMGDEIGIFGLEKRWEEFLRGHHGGQQVEVDALGRRVSVLHEVRDVPGHSVFLTLDRELQETAYQALDGREGVIVVLEVNSGAILAFVSSPGFDPNAFAQGISSKEWQSLKQNRKHPLNNRVIQGHYPPGSVFKIVLAIAALEEDIIKPDTLIFDPGYLIVGTRRFRDWKQGGHGSVNLHRAIVESCDVYFYRLGQMIGIDRIARYARVLGLGEKTGIALDGEKEGLVPDPAWKKKRYGQPWYPGETPSIAIGQGYVSVTPLQIANLMAAVANGGTFYRPWFVHRVESLDGTSTLEYGPEKIRSTSFKESTLEQIRIALRDAVNTRRGTGGKARSDMVLIAGKTGTAQVAAMRGAIVKSEDLPYSIRDHAWFAAFAPVERPEIAVVILVEHGGHGGSAAAPLAKRVIERYFLLKNYPPGGKLASQRREVYADRP